MVADAGGGQAMNATQQKALNNRVYKLVDAARNLVEDFDGDKELNDAIVKLGDAYSAFVDYFEKVVPQ